MVRSGHDENVNPLRVCMNSEQNIACGTGMRSAYYSLLQSAAKPYGSEFFDDSEIRKRSCHLDDSPSTGFHVCEEEKDMAARRIASIMLGALVLIAPVSFAQQFAEWESKQDLFAANFPGVPTMTSITWVTEYGAKIPGRVYRATRPGPRTYSVTVVDYNPVQKILTEQSKACDQTDERCTGNTSFPGAGYWKNDVRGAMIYAAAKYMKGEFDVSHYAWSFLGTQSVENNELQLINRKDKSRTYVNIFMHHSILYIMEETAPANFPPPGLFVQSMMLKESDGTLARHYGVYFNGPTIDRTEATTCSSDIFGNEFRGRGIGQIPGNAPNRGGGAGQIPGNAPNRGGGAPAFYAGPTCESLPAAVRFQQGPTPMPAGTQAPAATP
jgi:hypothetical protein